jgi:hypothetical protein
VCTVWSPQNTEAARKSFIRSLRHSARRYSVALGISVNSLRRILHKDLNFHLCKMVMVQELSNHDMANCSTAAEHLIVRPMMSLSLWQKKWTSTYLAETTNRIFAIGQRKIHSSSINGLFTVDMRLFGVEWQTLEPQTHLLVMLKCHGTELLTIWFEADA